MTRLYTPQSVYKVHHPVHKNRLLLQTVSHVAVACYINHAGRQAARHSVTGSLNIRMCKTSDLSDF